MKKYIQTLLTSFQRFYILWLGFLFIAVSGCRSRGVDKSEDNFGSFSSERIGITGSLGEINHPDEFPGKHTDENLMPAHMKSDKFQNVSNDSVKKGIKDYVQQPLPDPMQPATAYGTMMYEKRTTIIINPEEE